MSAGSDVCSVDMLSLAAVRKRRKRGNFEVGDGQKATDMAGALCSRRPPSGSKVPSATLAARNETYSKVPEVIVRIK